MAIQEVKVRGQRSRSQRSKQILPQFGRFRTVTLLLNPQMAMNSCTKLEEAQKRCPIVFQSYPSNFQVTRAVKSTILTQIERFRTVTPVWIYIWRWNDTQSLMLVRRGAQFFTGSFIKFGGHTAKKIVDFDPNWPFPDCNSSLNLPMAIKWSTTLGAAKERCSIDFQGHPSNFKVPWDIISSISTRIENFRTVTPFEFTDGFEMMHKAWCRIEE